jgi:hypothetical protein
MNNNDYLVKNLVLNNFYTIYDKLADDWHEQYIYEGIVNRQYFFRSSDFQNTLLIPIDDDNFEFWYDIELNDDIYKIVADDDYDDEKEVVREKRKQSPLTPIPFIKKSTNKRISPVTPVTPITPTQIITQLVPSSPEKIKLTFLYGKRKSTKKTRKSARKSRKSAKKSRKSARKSRKSAKKSRRNNKK